LKQEHRVMQRTKEIQETSNQLLKLYEDEDGARKEELNALAPGSNERVFEAFYERLKDMRAYYRKFPDLGNATENAAVRLTEPDVHVTFTGEEADGRYIDLHEFHDRFLNLKLFEPIDYLTYLDSFSKFDHIPSSRKHGPYIDYLQALLDYMIDYFRRALPLEHIGSVLQRLEQEQREQIAPAAPLETATDREHNETREGGVYCVTCQKLFEKPPVYQAHLTGKKHVKLQKELEAGSAPHHQHILKVELLEKKVMALADQLPLTITNTRRNVEKKQSMTLPELLASLENEHPYEEEEEIEADLKDDFDDDQLDAKKWNPKGLPLDVTGKPIPYWLWKLHGLGVEYQCEICGNYSYWGMYAFEKHFSEWRHQNAMKILGIPNTKHFLNVTTINEALALHAKIKEEQTKKAWKPDAEEEYEDAQGNVIPKKTYELLQRQGLL